MRDFPRCAVVVRRSASEFGRLCRTSSARYANSRDGDVDHMRTTSEPSNDGDSAAELQYRREAATSGPLRMAGCVLRGGVIAGELSDSA